MTPALQASGPFLPRLALAMRGEQIRPVRFLLPIVTFIASALLLAGPGHAGKVLSLPKSSVWTGDLDELLRRRTVRILVPYSLTQFSYDKSRQLGVAAELGRQLEKSLNAKYGTKTSPVRVAFIPTPRARLLDDLAAGRGDIAAGSLTITQDRAAKAEFVRPWQTAVAEILVTGPSAPAIATLDDLAGKEIFVRPSSSYFGHLQQLNERLAATRLPKMIIKPAPDDLEDEDMMEMTNSGLLPFVVVDDFKAGIWAQIFTRLKLRPDLAVSAGGSIAWAIRKDSPKLRAELDGFVQENGAGTVFGNSLKRRYFTDSKILKSAYSKDDIARFEELVQIFQRYGAQYEFDYLMIAAQGYQESQLDQSRRSPRGAVGVMQILPKTAASKEIGITGIDKSADANINAGIRYMRHLADRYVNDPALNAKNRVLFTFAAYNAGPGNLRKFRRVASEAGLDSNKWFGNVENGAARTVGRETVQYVGNIYKYYVAYSLAVERRDRDATAKDELKKSLDGATPAVQTGK